MADMVLAEVYVKEGGCICKAQKSWAGKGCERLYKGVVVECGRGTHTLTVTVGAYRRSSWAEPDTGSLDFVQTLDTPVQQPALIL